MHRSSAQDRAARRKKETFMAFSPIDFAAIRAGTLTIQDVADTLTVNDLRQATEFSVNTMLACIATCTDADVSFVALDSDATEGVRNAEGEVLGWTLSHVIVHRQEKENVL